MRGKIGSMSTCEHQLTSLPNLRDLGGIHAGEGRWVRHGAVFRSEAPGLATPADLDALRVRLGIAEVIDLRRPEEHEASPLPPALADHARWHRVPFHVDAPPHVSDRAIAAGDLTDADMGRYYAWVAQRNVSELRQVLELLAEVESPALVHCAVGKDRTGVAVGIMLLALGVAVEEVVADYARSDEPMRQVLPRHDARLTTDRIDGDLRLRAPAAAMSTCLDHLCHTRGSMAAFLDELDVDGSLRGRLRARLTEAVPPGEALADPA